MFLFSIIDTSCPSSSTDRVCANVGSSLKLIFIFDLPVQHSTIEFHYYKKSNSRRVINITINADIYIKNVIHEDEGFYELELDFFREIQLKVASKYFYNREIYMIFKGIYNKLYAFSYHEMKSKIVMLNTITVYEG